MTDPPWSVVLLEDDKDTRLFFESCVRSHARLTLAASFATLTPARSWFESNTADVLLTDLALPDGHGLTLIRELAQRQPECDILVVSVFGDEDTVIACVEAGAVGWIHQDSTAGDVAAVIVDVQPGGTSIGPRIDRKCLCRLLLEP